MLTFETWLLIFWVVLCIEGQSTDAPNVKLETPSTDRGKVQPNIIARAEWGAKESSTEPSERIINPVPYVVIHHTRGDDHKCLTQANCTKQMRKFQDDQIAKSSWADLRHNFYVGQDGNVYEGLGWGVSPKDMRRYHDKCIGISVMGRFDDRSPAPAAIKAIKSLIAYGVSTGHISPSYELYGRNQFSGAHGSPGKILSKLIRTWPHWRKSVSAE